MQEKNLSVAEYADKLGVSARLIWKEIHERRLGHLRLGRRILIPPTEAERYEKERFVAAVDAKKSAKALLSP